MNLNPIYDELCEELKVFPRAVPLRTHSGFMRDHQQTTWLAEALARAYDGPVPKPLRTVRKRPARGRQR